MSRFSSSFWHLVPRLRAESNADRFHRTQAMTAISELKNAGSSIDSSIEKKCMEYVLDVFGDQKYSIWLIAYATAAGEFKEGWMPQNFYSSIVAPQKKGEYLKICYRSALTDRLFTGGYFPNLAFKTNEIFHFADGAVIGEHELLDILFKENDRVVFKEDGSAFGDSTHFFEKKNFDIKAIKKFSDGVFQYAVKQHSFFDQFFAPAAATIRFTTVVDDTGAVSVRSCHLRLGTNKDTHVKSASQIRVAVDQESGRLADVGYTSKYQTVFEHPDSQAPFRSQVIPNFATCLAVVEQLHKCVPFITCIGWDVSVNSVGNVEVFEWNGAWNEIAFSEMFQGPCFSDLGWESLR